MAYPFLDHAFSDDERDTYAREGFVQVERIVNADFARSLGDRFPHLFAGNFETGIEPEMCPVILPEDDAAPVSRLMVNPWRCDHTVANITINAAAGRLIADLNGWPGARLLQDNLHWKPPGSPGAHFHQDYSYHRWAVPTRLASMWIALRDTTVHGGTLCFARNSAGWSDVTNEDYEARIGARNLEGFLASDDHQADMRHAGATAQSDPEFAYIEVPAGGAVFFNDHIWHGSNENSSPHHRMAISVHCLLPETTFHPTVTGHIQCRYRKYGDPNLDEAYFPILWQENGYRTPWLDDYMRDGSAKSLNRT